MIVPILIAIILWLYAMGAIAMGILTVAASETGDNPRPIQPDEWNRAFAVVLLWFISLPIMWFKGRK